MTYDQGKRLREMIDLGKSQICDTFNANPEDFFISEKQPHLTSRVLLSLTSKAFMHAMNNINHQAEIFDLALDVANANKHLMDLCKLLIEKYEVSEEDKEEAAILIQMIHDLTTKIQHKAG